MSDAKDWKDAESRDGHAAVEPMTTGATLSGIFFEPERTFDALRERPRFVIAGVIIIAASLAFTLLFFQRVGYDNMIRQAVETSPRTANMTAEQKEQAIEFQTGKVFKTITFLSPILVLAILFALGGGLYLLGAMAMAKAITYKQALSVWVYSSLPPTVLLMAANIVLLLIRSDVDPVRERGGLVHANPSLLLDTTAHPVLGTLVGSIDLFGFYGLYLAALGLRKVARLSSGSAWSVVVVLWFFGILIKIIFAYATGAPLA